MDEVKTYTLEEAHKHFARTLNGKAWELLQKSERTQEEDELMVYTAYASGYHWLEAGTELHHQRAEWLIAHVYAELGLMEAALRHAERCLELTQEFSGLMKDFDRAYAYEGMARASALAGNREEALKYIELAQENGQAISGEEDRKIFMDDFKGGKWIGMK